MKNIAINRNLIKSIVVIFGFILFTNTTFSQQEGLPTEKGTEFILRGKALSMVIIEDRWLSSISLGIELRIKERFSIVADAVYSRYKYEEEVYFGNNYEKYTEFSKYDTRNYLAFEIRYYPKLNWVSNEWKWYINLFSKIGKRNLHVQDQFPREEGDVYRLNGNFNDIGSSIGVQAGKRFGVDFNVGVAYRTESRTEEVFHDQAPFTINEVNNEQRWIGNVRFHFYYNLSKK